MKSKHTNMWIIHIKLKCFFWKKNISWDKRKKNIQVNWTIFLCENKISELLGYDYVYVNRKAFVWVFNYMPRWEKEHLKL